MIDDPTGVSAFRSMIRWDRQNGAVGLLLDTCRSLAWLQTESRLEYCDHQDAVEMHRQALATMVGADADTIDQWTAWVVDGADAVAQTLIPVLHQIVQEQAHAQQEDQQ